MSKMKSRNRIGKPNTALNNSRFPEFLKINTRLFSKELIS